MPPGQDQDPLVVGLDKAEAIIGPQRRYLNYLDLASTAQSLADAARIAMQHDLNDDQSREKPHDH